jgi:predicted permease
VSGNFFSLLGAGTAVGQPFTAADDTAPGAHPVAVISYGWWQRRFGRDPGVVGRAVQVNGAPVTVVGVAKRGFHGVLADAAPDLFLPVSLRDTVKYQGSTHIDGPGDLDHPVWDQPNVHWLALIARRRPGVSLERASAVLDAVYKQELRAEEVGREDAEDRRDLLAQKLVLDPGKRGIAALREPLTLPLLLLMGVAGLVLLIACVNVANLLLARADRRRKEMAVRLGIGASRGRLVRQLVTESLLLAGLGGALGLAFGGWGSRILLRVMSADVDAIPLDVDLDWRKAAFAFVVALATGVIFGLAPALQATRVDLAASLKQGARAMLGSVGAGGGRRLPLGRALVALQIGLSLVLLVGAGLFVRSLQNLLRVDIGFVRQGVVMASVNPRLLGYDGARLIQLYARLADRLEAIPGVRSASLSRYRLLTGSQSVSNISLPGYTPRPHEDMDVQTLVVTPHFFATMGLPLRAGRALEPLDRQGAPAVAVVSEAFVRRFCTHGPAVGQRFGFGSAKNARDLEIVGVVKDGKYQHLDEKTRPMAYLPVAQSVDTLRDIQVRVAGETAAGAGAIITRLRNAVAEVAPDLPVLSVTTLDEQLALSLARERAIARLVGFFGLLALLLAAIGLYGVMSYSVSRRTGEIGLRMALGAPRGQVLRLVLLETARLTAIGLVVGLAGALILTRLAASQLYGITAHDPATLASATVAMAAVALLAGFLPARRAADTEPMAALRYE